MPDPISIPADLPRRAARRASIGLAIAVVLVAGLVLSPQARAAGPPGHAAKEAMSAEASNAGDLGRGLGYVLLDNQGTYGPSEHTTSGWPMTTFPTDERVGTVAWVSGPTGPVILDGRDSDGGDIDVQALQLTAEQWGHTPNGAAYAVSWNPSSPTTAAFVSLRIGLPAGTRAFSFYLTHGGAGFDDIFVNAYTSNCRHDEACGAGADISVDGSQGSRQVTVTTTGNLELDQVSISNYHRSVIVGDFEIRTSPDPVRYLTLGDSYSSGEAAPNNDGTYDGGACHRSSNAWASWVDQRRARLDLVANNACSGAKTGALTGPFKRQPAQVSAFRKQDADVDLVTLTIGGNDINFGGLIRNCVTSSACGFSLDKTRQGLDDAEGLATILRRTYAKVIEKIAAANMVDAHLVVVGYPAIFPATTGAKRKCLWLSGRELKAARRLAVRLDAVIEKAAVSKGASYISTLNALRGHEECSKDPWMYPIGRSGGDQRGHPTLPGQRALANVVARALS